MADDTLLWDRKETRRQLGGVSEAFLDALTKRQLLAPVFRGRYLPDEVRACVVGLLEERDGKSAKLGGNDGGNEDQEGRAVPGVGAGVAWAEGTGATVRQDAGGGRPKGKGVGGGGAAVGYPAPSAYMARR